SNSHDKLKRAEKSSRGPGHKANLQNSKTRFSNLSLIDSGRVSTTVMMIMRCSKRDRINNSTTPGLSKGSGRFSALFLSVNIGANLNPVVRTCHYRRLRIIFIDRRGIYQRSKE